MARFYLFIFKLFAILAALKIWCRGFTLYPFCCGPVVCNDILNTRFNISRSPDPWQSSSQDVSRNEPWSYNPGPASIINEAFDFTDERRGFERSQSFHQLDGDDYQRGGDARSIGRGQPTPFAAASSQRVASIGRRKRSPLGQPRQPAIPPPDYTPPGSPSFGRKQPLKSVLKSRSHYM